MKKVMFVASSGGHLSEMLEFKEIFNDYDYLLVTEKTDNTLKLKEEYNVKYVNYITGSNIIKYYFLGLVNIFKSIILLLKFNPQVIVTTGANTGGIFAYIANILKKKVIYIETIASVKKLSKTGNIIKKKSDKFFVQWESLKEYGEYIGRLK